MHEEAPHRLAELTDLDPATGEPIELGGAWAAAAVALTASSRPDRTTEHESPVPPDLA